MVMVLFEATLKPHAMDNYLALAGELKASLAHAGGVIRSERFSSLVNEGKLLSLSVWENEAAVTEWRRREEHRAAQHRGRQSLFEGYAITVVSPLRRYTDRERREAPADSNTLFES